jgi:DNA polymerase-3 subunit epsilon/ATP-dependent DNA helicase DinG
VLARFAQLLLHFARQHEDLRAESGYAQRLALDGRIRTQPQWSEIEIEWDAAAEQLRLLLDHCQQLCAVLEAAHWAGAEPTALLYREFAAALQQLSELTDQLDRMILAPQGVGRGLVAWLEVNETAASVQAACAPLYVGDLLEKEIVHAKRSVIFTSATLRAGESFAFIRERLGAWDVNTAVVASPFDYEQSALLYLPSDLAMPNHPNYQPALERALIDAAQASEGRTLALFTSYAHLRATAEGIRAPLDRLGITVLQHGVSSRQRLLRQYRASERAILLGTRSFWEGVDLPGDELLCLAIVRLPFAVPNDPLVAARSAEFDDPFHDYTLPDAILRFRQGFGRLIRRASDRGVVVLLDSRAWCKEYGQVFLESLPTCTVHRAPLANLAGEIQHWLAGNLRSPVRRRH